MALFRASHRTDFSFPEDAHDVRGMEVRTDLDDEKVGKVDDVLVDDDGSPRYLDVDLGFLKKHVLLPVGHAERDLDEDLVRVRGMVKEDFESIPEAVEGEVDRDYESRLVGAYDARLSGDRVYARPEYGAYGASGRGGTPTGGTPTGGTPTGGTPTGGTPPDTVERVDQLSEIDVADYDPDPRGWEVVTADGERIGRVDHLIGDTRAMKVRYLTVELDAETDRKVLVPTGYVDLDPDRSTVRLNALETEQIRRLPGYQGTPSAEYTERLHTELGQAELGPRWYEHPRYSTAGLSGRNWRR